MSGQYNPDGIKAYAETLRREENKMDNTITKEINIEEMEHVAGGYKFMDGYKAYIALVRKVTNAAYSYNYKKPHCPSCGAELVVRAPNQADEECCRTAYDSGMLQCEFCHAVNDPELWATNTRN